MSVHPRPTPRPKNDPVDPTLRAQGVDGGSDASDPTQFIVDANGEVSAGPGDAGRLDRPEKLPPAQLPRSGGAAALVFGLTGGALILLLLVFFG